MICEHDYAKSSGDLAILINIEVYEKELVAELGHFHEALTSPFELVSDNGICYTVEIPDNIGIRYTPVTMLGDIHLNRIE